MRANLKKDLLNMPDFKGLSTNGETPGIHPSYLKSKFKARNIFSYN